MEESGKSKKKRKWGQRAGEQAILGMARSTAPLALSRPRARSLSLPTYPLCPGPSPPAPRTPQLANRRLLKKMQEAQKGVWDLSDEDKRMALHQRSVTHRILAARSFCAVGTRRSAAAVDLGTCHRSGERSRLAAPSDAEAQE